MFHLLFAWFNIPFWGMIFFVTLLLGVSVALGSSDADVDSDAEIDVDLDTDLELDIDADANIDVDTDLELDVDADADIDVDVGTDTDIDTNIDTDADINASHNVSSTVTSGLHATADQLTHVEAESILQVAKEEKKKRIKDRNPLAMLLLRSLGYINAGKVPLSMVASCLLAFWGAIGLIANMLIVIITDISIFYSGIVGDLIFMTVLGCSFFASLPLTRASSTIIGKIADNKSYSSKREDYIGLTAKVVSHIVPTYQEVVDGKAIGILDLKDQYGTKQKIYGFIPDDCTVKPKYKDQVVLIDYIPEKRLYKVLVEDSDDYFRWQNS